METEKLCPNCRKALPPDMPLGLCPECLIKSGFPTETEPGTGGIGRFVPPPVEEIARLFPQFEILGFIGKGGMGAVYKARQPALDRLVALKVLPPAVASDPGFAERFNREARALARLSHPNIVAVYDFGQTGPLHYLVMEFVDGTNLRQVEQAGRLSSDQALAIVPQICEALQFAHNEGVVHRDIKPENLLLDKKGRIKITDFGIAKILDVPSGKASLTGAKDVVGTPHYMAPEQVEKPQTVDHRADIYSLGVVFYEMLTGELPLGKFAPPSKKVQVDVRLDEVVLHTLEKEPERRYQQASQVKTDVETIAGTPPKPPGAQAPPVVSNNRPLISAPAVALMIAGFMKLFEGVLTMLVGIVFFRLPHLVILLPLMGATIVFFTVIPAAVIIYGGSEMMRRRSYAWALAASIVSILFCSLVGLPVGIWALIVLLKQGVRESFSNTPAAMDTGKWLKILGGAAAAGLALFLAFSVCGFLYRNLGIFHHHWRAAAAGPPPEVISYQQPLQLQQPQQPQQPRANQIENPAPPPTPVQPSSPPPPLPVQMKNQRQILPTAQSETAQAAAQKSDPKPTPTEQAIPFTATSGSAPLYYQWYYNASNSTNPLASSLIIAPAIDSVHKTTPVHTLGDISQSFDVAPNGQFTMNVDRGSVSITAADQNTVTIHLTRNVTGASNPEAWHILEAENVVLEQDGNEISIRADNPPQLQHSSLFHHPNLDAHYEITVPRQFNARVKTMGGDVNVTGVQGTTDISTMGGSLGCKDIGGDLKAHTMGGDVRASDCKGRMDLQTMGGDITIDGFYGPAVDASTAGGSVSAKFITTPTANCDLHTVAGNVTVWLPDNAALQLEGKTFGGSANSDFPVQIKNQFGNDTLSGAINGGGPLLKMDTEGGNVEVYRRKL